MIVQADENGRGIEGDAREAADHPLQRQRIAIGHRRRHPGIGGGKAVGVELVVSGERFDHRAVVDRVALLG